EPLLRADPLHAGFEVQDRREPIVLTRREDLWVGRIVLLILAVIAAGSAEHQAGGAFGVGSKAVAGAVFTIQAHSGTQAVILRAGFDNRSAVGRVRRGQRLVHVRPANAA